MNTLFRTTLVALVVAMFSGLAIAEEGSHKKEGSHAKKDKPKVDLVEMTLTGKLVSTEVESKKLKDDGTKVTYTRYYLEDADGKKSPIAKPRAKKGEEPAVNLDDYVGKQVSIKAMGIVKGEGDKAKQYPKNILSVEEVAAP